MAKGMQHIEAIGEAFEVLSGGASEQEGIAAGVVGLYGLRVLAAAESYFVPSLAARQFARIWSLLKRETTALGKALNEALDTASFELNNTALRHHPDYVSFQEDSLTRAVLVLDKLDAEVRGSIDALYVRQAVRVFIARRVRRHVNPTTSLTTPIFLNELGAELLAENIEQEDYSVYDPTCGVGGSLRAVHERLTSMGIAPDKVSYYGQDINEQAVFIAAWNLLLSGATRFHLEVGDTLREPCFLNGNDLQRFDLVIAQPPPYYVDDDDFGLNDRYRRFRYGAVQSSRADYAFVQHVIASVRAGGRAVVILPVTTFSRSGFEEEIRANLVHAGILSASISFEGGVLLGKNTPAGMLVFDLTKLFPVPERVLFIDTPVEKLSVHQQLAEQGTTPKKLILDTYRMQLTKQGLSKSASLAEVKARQYSLAPQAYIPKLGIARVNTDVLDQQIKAAENEIHEAHLFFQGALLSLRNRRPYRKMVKRVVQPE